MIYRPDRVRVSDAHRPGPTVSRGVVSMWTKREHLPTSPLASVPEYAKELFEILEMRSLTPDYFERFEDRVPGLDAEAEGSWTIGLLLDSDTVMSCAGTGPVALTPVILLVTGDNLMVFEESSTEIVLSSTWDRMCRIDLKPVDEGDFQVFALSFFLSPLTLSERFPGPPSTPLDPSEIGVLYLYMHANPCTYKEIDRHWSPVHIPQELHLIPSLVV